MMIRLGPWAVRVDLVDKASLNGDYGDWDLNTKTVRIQEGLSGLEMSMTFIHEMFHAMSDLHHLRLSEQSVRALENTVTQLIQENPSLAHSLVDVISPKGPLEYDPNTWSTFASAGSRGRDDSASRPNGPTAETTDLEGVPPGSPRSG